MRLTLRTLLAYLDEMLAEDDAQDVAVRIEDSDVAQDVMRRRRDVMHRLQLGAPAPLGDGLGLDPNTVAEYLDNTLPVEHVPDFERVCLDSDEHLAEVASCHQILSLVLGGRVEVDQRQRRRLYGLLDAARQKEQAATASGMIASDPPARDDERPTPAVKSDPGFVDESRLPKFELAVVVACVSLGFVYWFASNGWSLVATRPTQVAQSPVDAPAPSAPEDVDVATKFERFESGNRDVALAPSSAPGLISALPPESKQGPRVAAPGQSSSLDEPMDSAMHESGGVIPSRDQVAESEPSVEVEPRNEEPAPFGDNDIASHKSTTSGELAEVDGPADDWPGAAAPGEAAPLAVSESLDAWPKSPWSDGEDAQDLELPDLDLPDSELTEQAFAGELSDTAPGGVAAATTGFDPQPAPTDIDLFPDFSDATPLSGASLPGMASSPEPTPGAGLPLEVAVRERENAAKSPFELFPPAARQSVEAPVIESPPVEIAEIAAEIPAPPLAVDSNELLLCRRQEALAAAVPGDSLTWDAECEWICPAGFLPTLTWGETKLTLSDGARVHLAWDAAAGEAVVELLAGRCVIVANGPGSAAVVVSGEQRRIVWSDAGSVAVEAAPQIAVGGDLRSAARPAAGFIASTTSASIDGEAQTIKLQPGTAYRWEDGATAGAGERLFEGPPRRNAYQQRWMNRFAKEVVAADDVQTALAALAETNDSAALARDAAVTAIAAGRPETAWKALESGRLARYADDVVHALQRSAATSPEDAQRVADAAVKVFGLQVGDPMVRLLAGFDEDQFQTGAAETLVNGLKNASLAHRTLALWNLRQLTGATFSFDPAGSVAERHRSLSVWQTKLRQNQLQPVASAPQAPHLVR